MADIGIVAEEAADVGELLPGVLAIGDGGCAVDVGAHLLNLRGDGVLKPVSVTEGCRWFVGNGVDNGLSQLTGTFATFREGIVDGTGNTQLAAMLDASGYLLVVRETHESILVM